MIPVHLLVLAVSLGKPSLDRVVVFTPKARQNRPMEFSLGITSTYENPFDPADVALDATVSTPSGQKLKVPGFFYQPFQRGRGKMTMRIAYSSTAAANSGASAREQTFTDGEILTAKGSGDWRVRFTPQEAGTYRFSFTVRDRQGTARRSGPAIVVSKGPDSGFVGIYQTNPRAFRLSTGQGFFPIGANIGWAGERGTRDYDDWLAEYGNAGANWGRVWLSPCWTTFALEQPESVGRFDQGNAWRLDYVLSQAKRNHIRLALCIDSYNVLRDRINWPEWERSPYNKANGGPISAPGDFWTSPEVERLYRNKLRYLVARWGSDPTVFSWEFWNEVDGVTDYQAAPIRDWHRRMAAYLHSIDPYRHLVSTSFGGNGAGAGDVSIFSLTGIDYSVSHLYDAPDGPVAIAADQARFQKLPKPHFVAEFGADASGSRSQEDPDGLQLHDSLWASIAVGDSGASMLWWWDSYIHPRRLYSQFTSVKSFMKGVDWGKEHIRRADASVEFQTAPSQPVRRDLRLEGGTADWSPSELNKPRTVRIKPNGVEGGPVAGFLHGLVNHPNLHNPVTFETDLPWATTLDVQVGDVSGYGGASLQVGIDGRQVLDEKFVDPDGERSTETLKKYSGVRSFPLSAGAHRIVIGNDGPDWVRVDYRFEKAGLQSAPPLKVWASVGQNVGYAWIRHEDRSWRNVIEQKMDISPSPPTRLVVSGLSPGVWQATLWDTWKGHAIGTQRSVVHDDGKATIDLPAVQTDIAVRLDRAKPK